MRWSNRRTRLAALTLSLLALLVASPASLSAAPRIDVTVGIAGHVVRLHYAPIRVEIAGLDDGTHGEIRVDQQLGNPAERPAQITHAIVHGALADGVYESTIPIYDPLNPLEVSVISGGRTLVSSTINVRMNRRTSPFPAVCGFPAQVAADAVFIDPADLPRDWWGLDGVRSLWIGGDAALSSAQWQAVAEWTLAGGSLVLLTGSDFYRIDSPTLRRLLPIADPHLATGSDGAQVLLGTLSTGSRVLLGPTDAPLAAAGPHGAGTVLMAALAVADLSSDTIDRIHAHVESARTLSTQLMAEATLREMTVIRPTYVVAPVIVAAMVLSFVWFARGVVRRRRLALLGLCVAIAVFAVVSGLTTNEAKRPVDLYASSTVVSIQDGYGIDIGWHSLYSGRTREFALDRGGGGFPLQSLIRSAAGTSFDAVSTPDGTQLPLVAHDRRDLESYGRQPTLLHVSVEGHALQVANQTGDVVDNAILLANGRVHQLPPIPVGEQTYVLGDGLETYLYDSGHVALELVFERLGERLGLLTETWLVRFDETERLARDGKHGEKVRDTRIELIRGRAG